VIEDVTAGAAAARRMADEVGHALGQGWTLSSGDAGHPDAYFFARDGYPRVRVSYNTTLGDAPQRVTLLVGP
jgi:hypothetical protein